MEVQAFLSTPVYAGVLGFLIGIGLISATAWSRSISSPSDPQGSITVMMLFMMGGMLLASGVLIAYAFVAPDGLLYFGLSLAAGFVIGLGVIAVVMLRQSYRD